MIRRAGLAAITSMLLVVLSTASVFAATKTVTIQNKTYMPTTTKIGRGSSVVWSNTDPFEHTASSDISGLFNTSFIMGGTNSAAITFAQAGAFAFHCMIHSTMHGMIKVKMGASPKTGTRSTTFTLSLATAAVPTGYTHDVQVSRNGAAFTALPSTPNMTTTFRPTRTGTYRFQTRLHQLNSTTATGWSPSATIKVS